MYAFPRSQASSSPIGSLPIELLSEIFSFCTFASSVPDTNQNGVDDCEDLDNEYIPPPVINVDTLRIPIILSSVSRHWRAVALTQAGLWANLCITPELIREVDGEDVCEQREVEKYHFDDALKSSPVSRLHTTPIEFFLRLSKNRPLTIFIDARDPDWNFSEPGVSSDLEDPLSTPPLFSSAYMQTVLTLMLPHIKRWKALTILTDTWAPMQAALSSINPCILNYGAPMLEAITLMRCNHFVSFCPVFEPSGMKEPGFLSRKACGSPDDGKDRPHNILPNLKYLSLRGVHVDWDALSEFLLPSSCSSSDAQGGLSVLDIASHCADVRPSLKQFDSLLRSTPNLRTLSISGSGPDLSDFESSEAEMNVNTFFTGISPSTSTLGSRFGSQPDIISYSSSTSASDPSISLPHLRTFSLGYRTSLEGRTLLRILDAPNVRSLELEDATYPGDPEEVCADAVVKCIGLNEMSPHLLTQRKDDAIKNPSMDSKFPLLQRLSLNGVKASTMALRTMFSALPTLQHLEMSAMGMEVVWGLVMPLSSTPSSPSCISPLSPCPTLRTLTINDTSRIGPSELEYIIGLGQGKRLGFVKEREATGAAPLCALEVHIDAATAKRRGRNDFAGEGTIGGGSDGTLVTLRVISEDEEGDNDDDDELEAMDSYCHVFPDGEESDSDRTYVNGCDDYEEDLETAFKPGGAFNDPAFDTYYSISDLLVGRVGVAV